MDRKVMNNAGCQCSLHRKTVIGLMMPAILPLAGGAGAVPEEEWNRTFGGTGNASAYYSIVLKF